MASSSTARPTSRFDWIVKNAKVLAARAAAGWKWPLVLLAAVMTLIATPASTHAAVAPNQTRPHLGVMSGNVTDTSTRLGRPGETRVLLKEQAFEPSRTVPFIDRIVTRSSGSLAWR